MFSVCILPFIYVVSAVSNVCIWLQCKTLTIQVSWRIDSCVCDCRNLLNCFQNLMPLHLKFLRRSSFQLKARNTFLWTTGSFANHHMNIFDFLEPNNEEAIKVTKKTNAWAQYDCGEPMVLTVNMNVSKTWVGRLYGGRSILFWDKCLTLRK